MNNEDLLAALQRVSTFGLGSDPLDNRNEMERVIKSAEQAVDNSSSAIFVYWLGVAYRNYTAWYIRGDERRPYMEGAVHYFEVALEKAKADGLPMERPDSFINTLGQLDIAGDLGAMLVKDKPVRDLGKAERVLNYVYDNARDYEPSLCSLVDLYYSKGMYEKSASIAKELMDMQHRSSEWQDSPAPYPAKAEAKAYRALLRASKKSSDVETARKWAKKLLATGYATDNDRKLADRL